MSTSEEKIIKFDKEGVQVVERRVPLLGDDDPREFVVERYDWSDVPGDELVMEIVDIEPELSGTPNESLESITFRVNRLERKDVGTVSGDFWEWVERETGITYDGNDVHFADDKNGKENLVRFVEFLHDHDILTSADVPIESGHTRYLLNDEPKHKDGDSMVNDERIGPDLYLETHYSNSAKKKHIKNLANRFRRRSTS